MRDDIKLFLKRTLFALSVVICLVLAFASCESGRERDLFFYKDTQFVAGVKGTVGGESVQAEIYCDTSLKEADEGTWLTVTYLSPEGMRGLRVSLSGDGNATVRLGESIARSCDFGEMVLPFSQIVPLGEKASVEKREGETYVRYKGDESDIVYRFSEDGTLFSFSGTAGEREFDLRVISFIQIK